MLATWQAQYNASLGKYVKIILTTVYIEHISKVWSCSNPWLAICKKYIPDGFFPYLLCFWLLCGFHYWQFCENFTSKVSTKRPMVNIFRRCWLMIFVSMRNNSKNLFYLMVVAVGMRGFLNIEGMMPNFLLTHSEVFLLVWFICRKSFLGICPLLTFVCCDIFSLKYSWQFDLCAASAGGVWNAFLTIQLVQRSGFDFLSQLLRKLSVLELVYVS